MQHVIKHTRTGAVLFTGRFDSFRACLGQAVSDNVCLDFAELSRACLINAELDSARMRHACLRQTNLTGANLSEADLEHADFTASSLYNTCLCFSSLRNCDFTAALFGATDIAGADLSGARFSTLSALMINFRDCRAMHNCLYSDTDGAECSFSRPPVFISGLSHPLVFLDKQIKVGPKIISYSDLPGQAFTPVRPGQAVEEVLCYLGRQPREILELVFPAVEKSCSVQL